MTKLYAKLDMTNPGSGTGTVINTQLVNTGDVLSSSFTWVDLTSITPTPGVSWTYNGTTFTGPATPAAAIQDVTPRQMRLALIASGISLASIDSAIASLP